MLSPALATLMFSISLSIFCSHIVTCILYLAAAGAIYLLWYTASQGESASASPSPLPLFLSSTAWKPYLTFYKVTEGLVLCHQKSLKGLLWQMLDSPDTGNLCTAASQNSACEETKTVSLPPLSAATAKRAVRIKQDPQGISTESNKGVKKWEQKLKRSTEEQAVGWVMGGGDVWCCICTWSFGTHGPIPSTLHLLLNWGVRTNLVLPTGA